MLLYVLGFLFVVTAMFGGYTVQDRAALQDDGERQAAGWMMGYHNAVAKACELGEMDCSSPGTAKFVVPPPAYVSTYIHDATFWQGVRTISSNNILYSYFVQTNDASGNKALGRKLSRQKVASRLVEAGMHMEDGIDFESGIFVGATQTVFLARNLDYSSYSGIAGAAETGVTPLASGVLHVDFSPLGNPVLDGSPIITSVVTCRNGQGVCVANNSPAFATAPLAGGKTQPTGSTPVPPIGPAGSFPGVPGNPSANVPVTIGDCSPTASDAPPVSLSASNGGTGLYVGNQAPIPK